ncbi:MAG: hypothetical protein Q8K91_07510, partial [Hylemonella sp.]|nr:hypothetical protein [Hylemonella sp.]MDP1937036.1 hypothetical protein [Hylemonella sp.]
LRYRQTGFNTLQGSHDLAVGKSRLLHVELPSSKILLLGPLVYRGDYLLNSRCCPCFRMIFPCRYVMATRRVFFSDYTWLLYGLWLHRMEQPVEHNRISCGSDKAGYDELGCVTRTGKWVKVSRHRDLQSYDATQLVPNRATIQLDSEVLRNIQILEVKKTHPKILGIRPNAREFKMDVVVIRTQ